MGLFVELRQELWIKEWKFCLDTSSPTEERIIITNFSGILQNYQFFIGFLKTVRRVYKTVKFFKDISKSLDGLIRGSKFLKGVSELSKGRIRG